MGNAKTKGTQGKRPLPDALAKRAEKAAAAKTARVLAEARRDLALIARRRGQIVEAFYDIGEALTRLKEKAAIAALGRKTFAEVCEKDAGMSVSQAQRLVEIARTMTREEALSSGQARATALIGLAEATPEDDTPGALLRRRKPLLLPDGKTLEPHKASARAIERAATTLRRAKPEKAGAGSRVGEDEARVATALGKALAKTGATVEVVAGRPGKPATFRFAGVTLERLAAFAAAITKVGSQSRG